MIQRRPLCVTFLAAGLGAVLWPAVAQETRKLPRIGFLEAGSASANQHFLDAFQIGLRGFCEGLLGKAAQLLESIVPRASRYAILWNSDGAVEPRLREARAAIRTLGKTPLPFEVHGSADFDNAFTGMRAARADALLVIADPLTLGHRQAIVELAARERIPAVYEFAEFARAGGLVAYSADVPALFQRAALYVDKILKGTPPGDLPVEQPTKFALVVNLKTAKALGLTIPQSLLLRADEVIE
jgi:putative ABC transport system substrate-binding protein